MLDKPIAVPNVIACISHDGRSRRGSDPNGGRGSDPNSGSDRAATKFNSRDFSSRFVDESSIVLITADQETIESLTWVPAQPSIVLPPHLRRLVRVQGI